MSHEIYFKAVAACLIGNIFHITAKVLMLWRSHKNANENFHFGQYLRDDKIPLVADAIFSFGSIWLFDELTVYIPWALGYVKAFFVLWGFGGSYLILNLLSRSEKKLRNIIDIKTNIADSVTTINTTTDSGHGFSESGPSK